MKKTIFSRQAESVTEFLVALRSEAGLTQRELAKKLAREHSLIGRLELGERRLDVVEFYWVCKACGADPEAMARRLMRTLSQIQAEQSRG